MSGHYVTCLEMCALYVIILPVLVSAQDCQPGVCFRKSTDSDV